MTEPGTAALSDGTVLPYTQSNGYMTALTSNADGGRWLTEDGGGVLHNPDGGVAGFRLRVGDGGAISTIGNVAVGRVGSDGIHLQVDALQGLLGGSPPLVSPTLENRGDSNPAQPTGSVTAGGVSGGSHPPNLAPAGADQEAALDAAKESMDIPLDEVPEILLNTKDGTVKVVKDSEILRYFDKNGEIVDIRHDYAGEYYPDDPSQNRGPHFNTPNEGHFDYEGPSAPFGPLRK